MATAVLNPSRVLSLQNALGATKDKTNDFLNIKNKILTYKEPSQRFKPQTNVMDFNQFGASAQSTGVNSQLSMQQEGRTRGAGVNKYNQMNDELGHGKNELPPRWVDIQESIEDKIKDVEQKFDKLKSLRNQRFKPKFNDEENHSLDNQINQLVTELTNMIKSSEKELRDMMIEEFDNDSDRQIRKNIQQSYVSKLQDVTRQLRQIEKEHLVKLKNLYGEEGDVFLDQLERKEQDFFADIDTKFDEKNKDLLQLEHISEQQEQRSEAVDRLVSQINDLAVLFKDLSTVVIEQGTILDRIDYNILEARTNVRKGNVELQKTLKREQSWRAKGCMSCLITSIVVCLVMLMMKHAL